MMSLTLTLTLVGKTEENEEREEREGREEIGENFFMNSTKIVQGQRVGLKRSTLSDLVMEGGSRGRDTVKALFKKENTHPLCGVHSNTSIVDINHTG
jgi:hypothetical protein